MLRRLATLFSALSLLLCVAACSLWAWSYVRPDGWNWSDGVRVPTAGYQVAWNNIVWSHRGEIYFGQDRRMGGGGPWSMRVGDPHLFDFYPYPRVDADHRLFGIGYQSELGYPMIASTAFGPPVEITRVWAVPWWLVVGLTALAPTTWLLRARRRRRRIRESQCVACDYDLRATPGRCPECGREGEFRNPKSESIPND